VSRLLDPRVPAAAAALLGLLVHPRVREAFDSEATRVASAALVLLLLASLFARAARAGLGPRLFAAGAAVLAVGLAWDGLRGHRGTLSIGLGESSRNFREATTDGRGLGLRPLGLLATLRDVKAGAAVLEAGEGEVVVSPWRAASVAGVRFGSPRFPYSGEALEIDLTLTDASGEHPLKLPAGETLRHGDLAIRLDRYFPDFALDQRNEPFSRSDEPRRPAALLALERGGQSYRAFALSGAPGLHRVEGLGVSFTLDRVDAARRVDLRVVESPAALVLLLGLSMAGAGLLLDGRSPAAGRHASFPALALGGVLCAALVSFGGSDVLRWSFTGAAGGAVTILPAVGLVLGLALLASLGGTLLVAAPVFASGAAAPETPVRVGRRGLILGATLSALGAALLLVQAGFEFGTAHEALLLLLIASGLAVALASDAPAGLTRFVAAATTIGLALVGMAAWLTVGDYDTPATAAAASVALFALCVSE
jgi:hypothetical protein